MALYQGASKTWYVINRRGEGRRRGGKRDRRRRRGRENKFIETRQIWKGPLCIPNNSSPRAIRIMSDDIYATNSGDEIFFFFYSINSPDPTEKKNEKREEENEWDYPREGDEERDPGSECETPAAVETLHPMLFSKRSSSAFDGRCREVGEGWEREFMRTIKENWTARILVWQAM